METNPPAISSNEFWQGRNVCVTGGGGFLGRFVVETLRRRGAQNVFVPHKKDYDLVQPGVAERLLADCKPDMVIHLAAHVGGIGANRMHPAEFFYENLMMGVQLLHASWQKGVRKFVGVGTICAYPKFTPIPFREENLWMGYPEETNAPYGLAKKMLLVMAQSYRQQYGYNAIHLLPVNLYGPYDNFDLESSHVIPAMIRKLLTAKENRQAEVVLWGDGSPTREFLYVADAAEAIALAAERYDGPEPVNLGSGQEISIHDLANLLARLTGFDGKIVWDTSKPNGQPRRALDVTRAAEFFGFRAQTGFELGLRETVTWYQREGIHGG
jgi:GDP-L-fucose synthase